MKVAIFTSCTIDELSINGTTHTIPGGPGLYSSLMAKSLRFDVSLYARVSNEANVRDILEHEGISIIGKDAELSTRFALDVEQYNRKLRLLYGGEKIEYDNGAASADGAIVTPVYDEITPDTFEAIKSDASFVFLDPQGFLRRADAQGVISLELTPVSTDKVSAIKVDDDELMALTGSNDDRLLVKAGIDHVLHTMGRKIHMISDGREYKITLPKLELGDTTGIGDIFSTTFCCTMLKENDPLWAFCFACGATQSAIDTHETGIQKVPSRRKVETSAAYYYNTVEFGSA